MSRVYSTIAGRYATKKENRSLEADNDNQPTEAALPILTENGKYVKAYRQAKFIKENGHKKVEESITLHLSFSMMLITKCSMLENVSSSFRNGSKNSIVSIASRTGRLTNVQTLPEKIKNKKKTEATPKKEIKNHDKTVNFPLLGLSMISEEPFNGSVLSSMPTQNRFSILDLSLSPEMVLSDKDTSEPDFLKNSMIMAPQKQIMKNQCPSKFSIAPQPNPPPPKARK